MLMANLVDSLVGVTVTPGFDLKDLQSAKLKEIQSNL